MYLSIDIGGTKTLIALFTSRGKLVKKHRFPTPDNLDFFLNDLSMALELFTDYKNEIITIVTAIPGIVKNNTPISFGNRPWKNPPIANCIKKLFNNCSIYFENDGNLATVYESSFYNGKTVYLTFSTGIGGGIAEKSELIKPATNKFEPGHKIYSYKDEELEWEDIASCAAIGKAYNKIATEVKGRRNYQDIAHRVSLGLPDVIESTHPDIIVIGGPLGMNFKKFIRPLKKYLKESYNSPLPKIVAAKRPRESVIYGSYLYGKNKSTKHTK